MDKHLGQQWHNYLLAAALALLLLTYHTLAFSQLQGPQGPGLDAPRWSTWSHIAARK